MTEESTRVDAESSDVDTSEGNTCGRVKWFNNKAGYGFITVTSGEHSDSDVFVHHSAIVVDQEQYRYLVQGEYVTFNLCQVDDTDHQWQAGKVKGINNGKLMCETRLENRQSRTTRDTDSAPRRQHNQQVSNSGHSPRHERVNDRGNQQQYRVRSRGQGPRDAREGDEWMLVRRRGPRNYSQPEVLKSRQSRNAVSSHGTED